MTLDKTGGQRIMANGDSAVNLSEFRAIARDDKIDLELVHDVCGETLCDVEHDDELQVLVKMAETHVCGVTESI
jgi:hypothetical protein